MSTSSVRSDTSRLVSRTDFMVMATGIVMFFLSFASWEGVSGPTLNDLGLGGNTSIGPGVTVNAWGAEFSAWGPCLVCFAIALGVAAHDFGRVEVPGIGGARPRWLLRALSAVSFALLTIRMLTLAGQHNADIGQARWGVYIAFIVAAVQLVYVFARASVIGVLPDQHSGSTTEPDGVKVSDSARDQASP
jgi:hypothetical protein